MDDIVNSGLELKFHGSTTGTTPINLPDNWNEIYIHVTSSYSNITIHSNFSILKLWFDNYDWNNINSLVNGYYCRSNDYFGVSIIITENNIKLGECIMSGNSTDNILQLYYR